MTDMIMFEKILKDASEPGLLMMLEAINTQFKNHKSSFRVIIVLK